MVKSYVNKYGKKKDSGENDEGGGLSGRTADDSERHDVLSSVKEGPQALERAP